MRHHLRPTFLVGAVLLTAGCSSATTGSTTTSARPATTVAAAASTAATGTTVADSASVSAAPSLPAGISGSPQQKVAELLLVVAAESGTTMDPACLAGLTAKLSDADANMLVAAYPNDPTGLSPAGTAIGTQLSTCVTGQSTASTVSPSTSG